MKKLLILHTGGTISMQEDPSGSVTSKGKNPMLDVHFTFDNLELVIEEPFNLPSPHITPKHMLVLKERILKGFNQGIDGVVITHGTDTLEETAFFLDCTIDRGYPIVLTGAMRSANELGTDGTYNYLTAIRVASADEAYNRGVLVVMNDEIHSARYVTKTHTTNVSTFQTPTHGPLGLITKKHLIFFQNDHQDRALDIQSVAGNIPIIKAYAGMCGDIFDLFDLNSLDGLVIEALGAGNLPPDVHHHLQRLLDAKIPVVLVSRCFNGIAEPVYAYDGGGVTLHDAGVLFARETNSQKARIKLLVALNAEVKDLAAYIEA